MLSRHAEIEWRQCLASSEGQRGLEKKLAHYFMIFSFVLWEGMKLFLDFVFGGPAWLLATAVSRVAKADPMAVMQSLLQK